MSNIDLFKLAFSNLFRRKSRTFLTVLSVVIGAVSIILMLSIGFGFQKQQESFIESQGAFNTITLYSTNYIDPESSESKPTTGIITDEILKKIEKMKHVKSVLPVETLNDRFQFKTKNIELFADIQVFPKEYITKDIKTENGISLKDLKAGEFVVGKQVEVIKFDKKSGNMEPVSDFDWQREKVFIGIGEKNIADRVTGQVSGKTYEEYKMKFAGTLENAEGSRENAIYVSRDTAKKIEEIKKKIEKNLNPDDKPTNNNKKKNTKITYSQAEVTVDNLNNVKEVFDTIKEEYKLEGYSNQELIEGQKGQMLLVQAVFGGIGSIALFVAAIGITNTMLMSIQERTKEIGVMKVIGAQIKYIRRMFLFEAMSISIIGGIIGVIISFGSSILINNFYQNNFQEFTPPGAFKGISYLPIWLPVLALVFSAFIGLVSGYLPAKKATKLSAIEAIRTG